MSFITRYRLVCVLLFIQLGLLGVLPAPLRAQDQEVTMFVSDSINYDNSAFVIIWAPEGFNEFRWRWEEPLDGSEEWQRLFFSTYFGYTKSIPMPPNFANDRCQDYLLFAEIRDPNGNIVPLQATARFLLDINAQIEIIWPERAMPGYTNQEVIQLRVTDNLNCISRSVSVSVDNEIEYFNRFYGQVFTRDYALFAEERVMSVFVSIREANNGDQRLEFQVIRDITPPVLHQINARLGMSHQPAQISISGLFLDAYAPLPWAIEWQFVDANDSPVGEPVYHILSEDEVEQSTELTSANEGTAFHLNVPLTESPIPAEARALRVSLFDRAGNGQAISPIPIAPQYTVFLPFVER
ncbi:hypothetical protein [Chloroflexus sp.]|uniref:hypothetical protein n=1 Tax=Chloroflexus sp. TaxID=1904827 RepID=UPI002618BA49|nr:hypothetical protein [uncultured Chloroflexus sp.]